MQKLIACVIVLLGSAVARAEIDILNGTSEYTIVLPYEATKVEWNAAYELQKYLDEVTGARLPIRQKAPAGPKIFVNNEPSLAADTIRIRSEGRDLHLTGAAPRGALYAVYTFLEDKVGVRWWTSTESTVPRNPTLALKPLDFTYTPKLRYRETFHWDVLRDRFEFAARMKLNGHFSKIPEDWGGHYNILGWCHTSYELLPPALYFKEHPDWYSLRKAKRNPDGGQMCWSNPAMQQEMARRALEWIKKNPQAGIISISQNDQIGFCECDQCKAIDAANGGAHSASLITGVNAIAWVVGKEYPDFLVETLAYQYTRKAPTQIKPAKNVLVRLCSIECDFSHPLAGEQNKSFGDDLRNWSKLADNLFVWNYVTNFSNYVIPHPNWGPIGDDLRFFVDHKVVGVFEQADSANHLAGDMLPSRCWVQAHLLWDPSLDQAKLTREFLNGYYGAAGPELEEYLKIVNAPAADRKFRHGCYQADANFLSSEAVAQCAARFDAAEKAVASDATLLARVKRERLALEHVQLLQWNFPAHIAAYAKEKKLSDDDAATAVCKVYEEQVKDFGERAKAGGVTSESEGGPFAAHVSGLAMRYTHFIPAKLPKPGEPLPPGAVDVQEDRFMLHNAPAEVEIVADESASNGKAARMPGSHQAWSVQFHLPDDSKEFAGGPWRCYVVARVKLKNKSGEAFKYGVFDNKTHAHAAVESATMDTAGDEKYHAYGFRFNKLTPDMYWWVSPPGTQGVEAVYIDRFYFVRDEK